MKGFKMLNTKNTYTTCEFKKDANKVKIGDIVMSYDFGMFGDCYVIGKVTGYKKSGGCKRYCIDISIRVIENKIFDAKDEKCFPPVNGTPILLADCYTNGVKKIS